MFDWSSSPVRAGGFLVTLAAGSILGDLVQNALLAALVGGVGLLLMVAGTWWWKQGFAFPESLKAYVNVLEGGPARVWGVDLEVENPGRADEFVARIDGVRGAKEPSPAVGTYPNWRGHTKGDAKPIARQGRAIFALCSWDPKRGSDGNEAPDVISTVNASTGSVPITLTEAGRKMDDLDRHELVYELSIVSEKTGERARYDVHVGTVSIFNPSPRVHVERIE